MSTEQTGAAPSLIVNPDSLAKQKRLLYEAAFTQEKMPSVHELRLLGIHTVADLLEEAVYLLQDASRLLQTINKI